MLTTVSGTYENGQITLDEALPIRTSRVKVIVTVLEETGDAQPQPARPKREFGRMAGTFTDSYWLSDAFNEPLDDLKDYM
jgi:hypothetical protein